MAEPTDRFSTPGRSRMPRWAPWAIGAGIIAAIVVLIVTLNGGGGGSTRGDGPPGVGSSPSGSGPATGAVPFAFQERRIVPLRVSQKTSVPDLSGPANAIQQSLTSLYGQAVVDRANWTAGPPATVWNAFAPDVRAKAQADRAAFTMGSSGRLMSNLQISSSMITIRYLLDPGGKIAGAQASVSIVGTGDIRGSGAVDVVVRSELLMQQVGGSWLITGYPSASVTVKSPNPPSTPSRTPASPAPSSSGSGGTP
jgi:hypothetical protein